MQSKALNIVIALIMLYGIVPYLYVNLLNNGNAQIMEYTVRGFMYSLVAAISLVLINKVKVKKLVKATPDFWLLENEAAFFYPAIFILSAISFALFPWHASREGLFASISALFRILWILVSIPLLKSRRAYTILFLTVLLMFLDGSRTFAFIIFIYYFLNHRIPRYLLILGIVSVLLVASFRNGFYTFNVDLLLYGIFGEGVNGSSGLFQVVEAQSGNIQWSAGMHLLYTFFQPFLILVTMLLPKGLINVDSSQFMSTIVNETLGQQYYPMGGFYILSEFAPYGYIGIVLFCVYFFVTYRLSSLVLNSRAIYFAPALLFMMIKSSPFTYWKWVIWFFIFQLAFKILITGITKKNV